MLRTLLLLCAALWAVFLVVGMAAPWQSALSAPPDTPGASGAQPAARPAAAPGAAGPEEKADPADGLRAGKDAIEEALAETTSCDFTEAPLSDVLTYLRDKHKVNIVVDKKAMDDAGIGTDTPITKKLSKVTLRSALNLLLRDINLTWTIQDEVLMVTTTEQAEAVLSTEVYDVADLVTCRDENNELWEDYDTLVDAITSTVKPTMWDTVGGPGAIKGATFGAAKVLIVAQTRDGHDEVVALLEKLRGMAQQEGKKPQPPRRNRPDAGPLLVPGMGGVPGASGAAGKPGGCEPTPPASTPAADPTR